MKARLALAALLLLAPLLAFAGEGSPSASMVTVFLQNGLNGYTGCEDSYLDEARPTFNFGGSDSLLCAGQGNPSGGYLKPIIRFELAGQLPAGAVITRARLWTFAYAGNTGANSPIVHVHRVLSSWTEGTANAATQPGSVTHNKKTSTDWVIAGAQSLASTVASGRNWGAGNSDNALVPSLYVGLDTLWSSNSNDCAANVEDRTIMRSGAAASAQTGWSTVEITHLVEKWWIGANKNCGVLLWGDEDAYGVVGVNKIYSSEHVPNTYGPKLEISYVVPGSASAAVARRSLGGGGTGLH